MRLTATPRAMADQVADFIRRNYSCDGLEVTRQGKDHVVIAAPPEIEDLTDMLKALETEFDAVVDLHYRNRTVELICRTAPAKASAVSAGSLWGILATVTMAAGYMAATRYELAMESLPELW